MHLLKPKKVIQVLIFSLILSLGSRQASVAEPPPLPEDILKLGLIGYLFDFGVQCEGKSDLPHISRHKPGTVNVLA